MYLFDYKQPPHTSFCAQARQFWRFLRDPRLPSNSLAKVHIAVLGLGDSTYDKYNAAARMMHMRLLQLGANPLEGIGGHALAGADACSPKGTDGDINGWLTKELWPSLLQINPLPKGFVVDDSPRLEQPRFKIEIMGSNQAGEGQTPQNTTRRAGAHNFYRKPAMLLKPPTADVTVFSATLTRRRQLTVDGYPRRVVLIELDITGDGQCYTYNAGDVAVVYPDSSTVVDVDEFAAMMGYDLRAMIRVLPRSALYVSKSGLSNTIAAVPVTSEDPSRAAAPTVKIKDASKPSSGLPFPTPCSVRELLTKFMDLNAEPSQFFFSQLSNFCSGDDAFTKEQQSKCMELASQEGLGLYNEYVSQEHRSCAEVLRDFPATHGYRDKCGQLKPRVPLAHLIDMVPLMRPRQFSIASAPNGRSLELCVAVVNFAPPMAKRAAQRFAAPNKMYDERSVKETTHKKIGVSDRNGKERVMVGENDRSQCMDWSNSVADMDINASQMMDEQSNAVQATNERSNSFPVIDKRKVSALAMDKQREEATAMEQSNPSTAVSKNVEGGLLNAAATDNSTTNGEALAMDIIKQSRHSQMKSEERKTRRCRGVCSNYLEKVPIGTQIPIWLRRGPMRLNIQKDETGKITGVAPMICIGAGTGIAPLRSLLQRREALMKHVGVGAGKGTREQRQSKKGNASKDCLIFGVRYCHGDFLFEKEWMKMRSEERLDLHVAFSREMNGRRGHAKKKMYVQNLLSGDGIGTGLSKGVDQNMLWSVLTHHPDVQIFVAGNAALPKEIKNALKRVAMSKGLLNEIQATQFVGKLEREGRLVIEAWS